MTKRALCVGVDEYTQPGMALRGCVNDSSDWATLLRDHFDFTAPDIRVLVDREATHDAVVAGLKALLGGAAPGDVLVFTNSSHGTYAADGDGDEASYDEAICPYDVSDHLLVDDELRTLFADVPAGVRLTVVSDSCHSGTITRSLSGAADDRRARFMPPRAIGRRDLAPTALREAQQGRDRSPVSDMREVLLAGCQAHQLSFEAAIEGTPHGAFSFYALRAIRAAGCALTYRELQAAAAAALRSAGYRQDPQVEGADASLDRQIFT